MRSYKSNSNQLTLSIWPSSSSKPLLLYDSSATIDSCSSPNVTKSESSCFMHGRPGVPVAAPAVAISGLFINEAVDPHDVTTGSESDEVEPAINVPRCGFPRPRIDSSNG